MRKEIEEIREALQLIHAYNHESEEALRSLEEAIDEIDQHPALGKVEETLSKTAPLVRAKRNAAETWQSLTEHLEEWEDHHPGLVLSVGKVARAFAVLGL